jgi:hypothetical protein
MAQKQQDFCFWEAFLPRFENKAGIEYYNGEDFYIKPRLLGELLPAQRSKSGTQITQIRYRFSQI